MLPSRGCRSQRLVVAFGLDPVLVPVAPFERRVSFYRFRVCLISGLLIFKICSQRDLESAPDFIKFFGRNEFEEDAIYGNGGILCLKGSNVFGRHTNNETTNRFGWGNTAKAQKVETSIEVRIAHQARLNFVNVEINVLLSSQKLVTV